MQQTNLIAISCIVSLRFFWTTMLNARRFRAVSFTDSQTEALDRLQPDKESRVPRPQTLSRNLTKLAVKLGGHLARKDDPVPGNTVIWRGLTRLTLPSRRGTSRVRESRFRVVLPQNIETADQA